MSSNVCTNCGASLSGRFCHDCGQKARTIHVSTRELLHEALEELAHLDGKIAVTLKTLVVSPGKLTKEFFEGRRVRYIAPLRLYLTCSLLFFALAALAPESATRSIIRVNDSRTAAAGQRASAGPSTTAVAARMRETLIHMMPRAMFLLMPAFALLTWLFYKRAQPFYIAHLYYSLHFHAFVFLMTTVWLLLSMTGSIGRAIVSVMPLVVFAYHFMSLSRVFGESRLKTAMKGMAIGLLYWLAVAAVVIALAFSALRAGSAAPSAHARAATGKMRTIEAT